MEPKILIVDDESDIVLILKTALEQNGYRVETASNGFEAWDRVSQDPPDLIILDIMMPKMDGHSMNLKLKDEPRFAKIPVVIITGRGQLMELLNLREEVAIAAYLEKPFTVSTLIGKVRELLGK